MDRTVYVPAHGVPIGRYVNKKVPSGKKKRTLLGLGKEKDILEWRNIWQQTGFSSCEIDGKRLAQDVQVEIDKLNAQGFKIISISPVISGNWSRGKMNTSQDSVYGYGYSYTSGMIILARKEITEQGG